jgi:hypothetical protein
LLFNLATWLSTWLLARALNMPQSLVHAAGLFVFLQVQAFENNFLKALCPKRLKRRLRALFRAAHR